MGSQNGAPIPIYLKGRQVEFRKDKDGHTVVSKLNEQMLQEIAVAGNGTYVRATNADSGLKFILDRINGMEKAEFGTKIYTDYEDRFQYFFGIALFFLLLDFFTSTRKSKLLAKIDIFNIKQQ